MLSQQCHTCGLEVELKATIVGTMLVVMVCAIMGTYYTGSHNQQSILLYATNNLLLASVILLCGLTFTSAAN